MWMTPYREFKNFRDNGEGRVFSEDVMILLSFIYLVILGLGY